MATTILKTRVPPLKVTILKDGYFVIVGRKIIVWPMASTFSPFSLNAWSVPLAICALQLLTLLN